MDDPAALISTKKRRSWLRFSLRSLLLFVTVLAIWLGFKVSDARRERAGCAAIERLDLYAYQDYHKNPKPGAPGKFIWNDKASPPGPDWLRKWIGDEYFCKVVAVFLDNRDRQLKITNQDLAELANLSALELISASDIQNRNRLRIRPSKAKPSESTADVASIAKHVFVSGSTLISDDTLVEIGRLTQLKELYLDHNAITDDGLKHLQGLSNLENLDLEGTDITDAGLQYLPTYRLECSGLENTNIDDEGLKTIGKMAALTHLNLSRTDITDAGLKHLSSLNHLEDLDLSDTQISGCGLQLEQSSRLKNLNLRNSHVDDAGLEQIAKLRSIETILLEGSWISDAGLMCFRSMSNLKFANLDSTNVTDAGLQHLKVSKHIHEIVLPGNSVTYDGVYKLQKELPLTKIHVRPRLGPFTEEMADNAKKRLAMQRMSEEERKDAMNQLARAEFANRDTDSRHVGREEQQQAAPLSDEFGAKWKIRISEASRKNRLLGRPKLLPIFSGYFPWNNSLLQRNLETGRVMSFDPIRLRGPMLELAFSRDLLACVLDLPDDSEMRSDILLIRPRDIPFEYGPLKLHGHTEPPWRLILPPQNEWGIPRVKRLISCSDDGTTRLWSTGDFGSDYITKPGPNGLPGWQIEIQPGQEVARFKSYGHDADGSVTRGEFAAFSPFGRWLATVYENRISFRSPNDGTEQFAWEAPIPKSQRIMAIRFDPHGNTLLVFLENATASEAPGLRFFQYDIDAHRAREFRSAHGVVDGRATADGGFAVTWDGSPQIVFWDLKSGSETSAVAAQNHVCDFAFSPKGNVLATAGDDGEVKFWSIADRTQLKTKRQYRHDAIDFLGFAYNGKALVTASGDGWLKVWDAPEFTWQEPRPVGSSMALDSKAGIIREISSDGKEITYRGQ